MQRRHRCLQPQLPSLWKPIMFASGNCTMSLSREGLAAGHGPACVARAIFGDKTRQPLLISGVSRRGHRPVSRLTCGSVLCFSTIITEYYRRGGSGAYHAPDSIRTHDSAPRPTRRPTPHLPVGPAVAWC